MAAKRSPMYNIHGFVFSVFVFVRKVKALGSDKIKLVCGSRFFPSNNAFYLEVYFWPIESCFAFRNLKRKARALHGALNYFHCFFPALWISNILCLVF